MCGNFALPGIPATVSDFQGFLSTSEATVGLEPTLRVCSPLPYHLATAPDFA
jgi:hypothetical protein